MGRQIGDSSTMVNSSIALLQERFKELQRVKEKRQEKELLKLFSESSERNTTPSTPSGSSSPSSSSSSRPLAPAFSNRRPTASPPAAPPSLLSLGLHSSYDHQSLRNNQASFWSGGTSSSSSQRSTAFEHSDVDTSLHL
ncbi:unnamed protein product [Linum tenue]|uniref:Uncharacterized protein n=1 Tax=Linum tenue TaxID=586396 RepID=A0AAV0LGV0_9ROSI|nr:unnamed protein product [Linum tenue]